MAENKYNFNVTGMTGTGHHLSGNTIKVVGLEDNRTAPPPATPFIDNRMQTRDHREDHTTQNEDLVSVGNGIFYNKEKVIHKANNVKIYVGYYEVETKEAAVKRLSNNSKLYYTEIKLLRRLDHRNILKYFATYTDDKYHYIATELADKSLETYITENKDELSDKELLKLTEESCLGLKCLHDQNILHRDIKPSNILISFPDNYGHRRAMIADFETSKILGDTSSTSSTIKGTNDWLAPEALEAIQNNDKTFKQTKECDIFSMGCTIYYVITRGKHPFGKMFERPSNIIKGLVSWENLERDHFSYFNLIKLMLSVDKSKRPQITAVIMHPTFWDGNESLQFLTDVSNRLKIVKSMSTDQRTVNQLLIDELNSHLKEVCTAGDWMQQLNSPVQQFAKLWRKKYDTKSVVELIEFIRDKRQHLIEWTEEVKQVFGKTNETYIEYFMSLFPRLLVITYVVMQKLKQEEMINSYYMYNLSNADFEL